jgi:hypothetical protein
VIDLAVDSILLPNGGTLQLSMVDHDILGNDRPEGDGYDAGAFEFSLPLIDAWVNLDPDTLNLKSKGRWITAYISLPTPYDVQEVILESVLIDQSIPAVGGEVQDGVLVAKFDRDLLASYLAGTDGHVTLTVTGTVGDVAIFRGSDTIRAMSLPPSQLTGAARIQAIGADTTR